MDRKKKERKRMRFLRQAEVEERTGLGKVSIWRMESRGEFPQRVRLIGRAVGWVEEEIDAWIEERAETDRVELGTNTTAHDAS